MPSVVNFYLMLEKELETAISLARQAGNVILRFYEDGFAVEQKAMAGGYSEPVTEADRAASHIIVEGLKAAFPEDGILSEEAEDNDFRLSAKRTWMIDPIDGTQGFLEKAGDFAVQIGLTEAGEPILGVVFQPIGDILYFAVKGGGAFLSEKGGEPQRLQVSEKGVFPDMTLAVSRSHRSSRMKRLNEHFGFTKELPHGSVGLKIGLLARQAADIYIHLSPRTKFWDTAAPQIILEEAGGRLTDLFGNKLSYKLQDVQNHNGILASNGVSHEKAVNHLRPLLTEFGRLKVLSE